MTHFVENRESLEQGERGLQTSAGRSARAWRERLGAVRRKAIFLLLISGALLPLHSMAQQFPAKRITLIVPFSPGGQADLVARMLSQRLNDRFGQPVVVENRASVSGNVGAAAGARSPADGYTVTFLASSNLVGSISAAEAPYNFEKDFAPVMELVRYYSMLVVQGNLPARNISEFIALAKSRPGKLNSGISSVGSSSHFAMALLAQAAGIDVLYVPYKGEGQVITALLTGEIDLTFSTLFGAGQLLKTGKVRGLAVTTPKRSTDYPDMPAVSEVVPGFEYSSWMGIAVPDGTPRDRIDLLNKEAHAFLQVPEVRQNLASRGFVIIASTPEQFKAHIRTEMDVMGKMVKKLGIKAD